MAAVELKIQVFGLLNDISFVRAKCCAEDLQQKHSQVFAEPDIQAMLECDWDIFIENKKKELRGDAWTFTDKAITFVNGQLIGSPDEFVLWAEDNYNFEEFRPEALYQTLTEEGYKNYLNSTNHDFVFMDISINNEEAGRLVIELFNDSVPKTCENFKALCTGEKGEAESHYKLSYHNSLFHRIVPNGWIQGGDIYHGRGNGGESIYGQVFEDENFAVKHCKRGIVSMANKGRHTNGSQFFITLNPAAWMDTKYVAFGQVIEGTETLRQMEEQETMNERPNKEICVTNCGICTYEF